MKYIEQMFCKKISSVKNSLFCAALSSLLVIIVIALLQQLHFRGTFRPMSNIYNKAEKQAPEMFCKKRCSQKFRKINRKTPVPEPQTFNKVPGQACTLLKQRLWHRCFPVDFNKLLRTRFAEHIWATASESLFVKIANR